MSTIDEAVIESFPEKDQGLARHAFDIAQNLTREEREQTMLVFLIMIYGKLLDLS